MSDEKPALVERLQHSHVFMQAEKIKGGVPIQTFGQNKPLERNDDVHFNIDDVKDEARGPENWTAMKNVNFRLLTGFFPTDK